MKLYKTDLFDRAIRELGIKGNLQDLPEVENRGALLIGQFVTVTVAYGTKYLGMSTPDGLTCGHTSNRVELLAEILEEESSI